MSLLNQAIYADSQSSAVFQEPFTLLVTNKHRSDNDQRDWMLYLLLQNDRIILTITRHAVISTGFVCSGICMERKHTHIDTHILGILPKVMEQWALGEQ